MRGLKLRLIDGHIDVMVSHLLQMRGLKLLPVTSFLIFFASHLLQMRGLKHLLSFSRQMMSRVASFTDAWIETFFFVRIGILIQVASFTDAWIETL